MPRKHPRVVLCEAREVLGFVARALPRRSARELRKRLEELDARY
ncbi:hypothetical protein ACIRG5_32430 [Lentzea sp. NPDC102401]